MNLLIVLGFRRVMNLVKGTEKFHTPNLLKGNKNQEKKHLIPFENLPKSEENK